MPRHLPTDLTHTANCSINLVENVWQFLRQNLLSHRVWESYDAIVDACCDAWNTLMRMPEQVMSITIRAWARVNV